MSVCNYYAAIKHKLYKYCIYAVNVYYIILNSCCNKNVIPPPSRSVFRICARIHLCNTLLLFVLSFGLYVPPPTGSLGLKSCPRRWLLTSQFSVISIILHSIRIQSISSHLLTPSRKISGRPPFPSSPPLDVSHIGGHYNLYLLHARSFRLAPRYTWFEHSSEDLEHRVIYFNGGYPYNN